MALVGIKLVTLVSEPDALTTRPPPCANFFVLLKSSTNRQTRDKRKRQRRLDSGQA